MTPERRFKRKNPAAKMSNQPPFYLPLPATLLMYYSSKLLDLNRVVCYYICIVKVTKKVQHDYQSSS